MTVAVPQNRAASFAPNGRVRPRRQPKAIDFQQVPGRASVVAFFMGMAIIAGAIISGPSTAFGLFFLIFSFLITLVWRKGPVPWILLTSISAAVPLTVTKKQFPCNLVFALWLMLFNVKYLSKIPRWLYVPTALAIFGIFTSSINWMSEDATRNVFQQILRQGAEAYNLLLPPFVLLPVIYFRMRESHDNTANMLGLLFCLILPPTAILFAAKFLGRVSNLGQAMMHVEGGAEGWLQYQLGRVIIDFNRTEVGFILAALICASAAIALSRVKPLYRLVGGACLVSNALLLFATASFGSAFACLCGLAVMFYIQFRTVSVTKVIVSVVAMACMVLLVYSLSSSTTKGYLEKRYEHRVTEANMDRLLLWSRAVQQLFEHPEGVGFTMEVGERVKTFTHNDYLAYAVSYGIIGGLGYVSLVVALMVRLFRRRKSVAGEDPAVLAIYLAGLGVLVAVTVNSITDHMNANRSYFNVIWSVVWYSYFCARLAPGSQPSGSLSHEQKKSLKSSVQPEEMTCSIP